MSKKQHLIRTFIFTLVSLSFLAFGVWQLMGKMNADFLRWRFPLWSIYLIGGVQVLGALGIWFKKTASYSTFGLMVIAIGAIFTLIGHHEWPIPMLPPIALFLLTSLVMRYNMQHEEA
jgi:CHASE2 domain-containing sensor protein